MINGIDVSGKTPEQAGEYFAKQSLDRQVVLLEDGKEVLSHSLTELGYPLLVGLSRKSMIYKPLGLEAEYALPGSLAFAWEALRAGAKIIRVHDVAPTRQIVDLYNHYNRA